MTARARAIIVCDFLVVETVLLKRLHVLAFIEHATRRLHLAGVTARPTAAWAVQQARNLAMDLDDRLGRMRFKSEGLRIITTLPRTPWMNATCERVIGTLRREMLDRTLILSDRHLDLALREYVTHYHGHRPHQSRQQRPPDIETQPSWTQPTCGLSAEDLSSQGCGVGRPLPPAARPGLSRRHDPEHAHRRAPDGPATPEAATARVLEILGEASRVRRRGDED